MRITFFSTHRFEQAALRQANLGDRHQLHFLEARLTEATAALAAGAKAEAVCAFVSDRLTAPALEILHRGGVRLILLRCAGFDQVDLSAAERLNLPVLRVPAYSPHSVAEHAFALLLGLVRKIPQARARVREGNFMLDGLVGFDLFEKTFGVVGTGRIGAAAARIARGFGCRVLATDAQPNLPLGSELGMSYVELDALLAESDVVSLHLPLSGESRHLIDRRALQRMKRGSILINTSRGALVDTAALVDALKEGHLGGAALDVYEGEGEFFFQDHSQVVISDELLMWLTHLPNVLITAHQGFLTAEALANIAQTTLDNATAFESGRPLSNQVTPGISRPPKV